MQAPFLLPLPHPRRHRWGAFVSEPCSCLPQVQERFLADGNDRLKLVVLLCGEDDDKVQNAAAGALAMLTAAHKKLCIKMTQVVSVGPGTGRGWACARESPTLSQIILWGGHSTGQSLPVPISIPPALGEEVCILWLLLVIVWTS